jgi:hypothetical protein
MIPNVPGVADIVTGLTGGAADDSTTLDSRTKDVLAFVAAHYTKAQNTVAFNAFKAIREKFDTPDYANFLGY